MRIPLYVLLTSIGPSVLFATDLLPTAVFTTNADSPAATGTPTVTGAANVNSGDLTADSQIYIRERVNNGQEDRRISSYLNFDVSSLTLDDLNSTEFSVTFVADYDYRLNDLNTAVAVVGRVTTGAWDGTTTLPLHSWGIDDAVDEEVIISNIASDAPPRSVEADVTDIVAGWVNGTTDNFGLAVYINDRRSNAAGFSNARLVIANAPDRDDDGLPDSYEVANGLDPDVNDAALDNDANGGADGLTNLQEFTLGTDPQDSDSDDDGLNDGNEVNGALNPWFEGALSGPPGDATNPLDSDSDGDGVDDNAEILAGTDPNRLPPNTGPIFPFIDSDNDSYRDEAEVAFGSSPNDASDIPDNRRPPGERPNVVIIYADDLGFGDISAYGDLYGTTSSAPTPNIDTLATDGVVFTQGHSGNGVCTPSRYALLTGKYNWREFDGITGRYGFQIGGGELPRPSDVTIAEFLKTQQYDTAAIGKWHLGGGFYFRDGTRIPGTSPTDPNLVDWERRVDFHATDNGFDEFRGNAVAINFPPYIYLKDDRMQIWDSTLNRGAGGYRDALNNDTYRLFSTGDLNAPIRGARGSREGLGDPTFSQLDLGPQLVTDTEDYIADRATRGDTDPFFIYIPLHSPHRPWAVTDEFFSGDSNRGAVYADWMTEVDARVGRILDAIDNNGFGPNTMVVFTSDNGPESDMQRDSLSRGTDPNGPLRGHKRETYDGGTRVPFMVRWPGQAAAGMKVNVPIWQGDIFATIAAYLGVDLPDTTAPDGESFLNLIRGQAKPSPQREAIVMSGQRGDLALKTFDGWKFIDGSGGSADRSWNSANVEFNDFDDMGNSVAGIDQGTPKQLFNFPVDLGEDGNLIMDFTDEAAIRSEITALAGRDLLGLLDDLRVSESTALFPRIPDNDGDGLPNTYEQAIGLDSDWPLDAGTDLDGDGASNLSEFVTGTDPNSASDFFRISDFNLQGNDVVVNWQSVLGRRYELVYSLDLVTWVPISAFEGTGGVLTSTIDQAAIDSEDGVSGNLDRLFVRVEVLLSE